MTLKAPLVYTSVLAGDSSPAAGTLLNEESLFLSLQLTGSSYTALPQGNDPAMLFGSFASSVFILVSLNVL